MYNPKGFNIRKKFKQARNLKTFFLDTVSAMFGIRGVVAENLQSVCQAISIALHGNTQYCSMSGPQNRKMLHAQTLYMNIGVDDCQLATQQINSFGFSSTVQELPLVTIYIYRKVFECIYCLGSLDF